MPLPARWTLAALLVIVGLTVLARTALPPAASPHAKPAPAARAAPPVPAALSAPVDRLRMALEAGDVERLCRPNAIFTPAVVQEMAGEGPTCEAAVEDMLSNNPIPPLTVVGASVKPDLATARVRGNHGQTVPLTLVRDRQRWLVSFSDGTDPLSALMV